MQEQKKIWETYAASWKAETSAEKRQLFEQCLAPDFQYNDPLILTKGWDELDAYMLDFHKQIPGGYFVTTWFFAHSGKSIAQWEMRGGDDAVLGTGISYGEHNEDGKLISETGFFEPPPTN